MFCTYLIIYHGNKLPKFYLGSTTVEKLENGYRGSVSSLRYGKIWNKEVENNSHLFSYKIISLHKNRKEAFDKELKLQLLLKVRNNPLYANMGYAAPNGCFGFSYSGKEHWSRQPGKVHNWSSNHPKGMLGKKHSKERNEYMSEIQLGDKNHFYGKKHTEDTIKKISETNKTPWITNGTESRKLKSNEVMPESWYFGRTISVESKKWINDCTVERQLIATEEIPAGWLKGRLKGNYQKNCL